MRRAQLIALLALVFVPRVARPQGMPLGSEFRVNSYTTGHQYSPSVAADAAGDFVVVWSSVLNGGSILGVFGQRYDSSGASLGPEFRVNSSPMSNLYGFNSSIAVDAGGNFVVVWTNGTAASGYSVFGQRFVISGAPLATEFRINTSTTSAGLASVASDASGNVVVVWNSDQADDPDRGVFGQRYASSGAPLGTEFRVNTYTTSLQNAPSVASDASGNFVVVWTSLLAGPNQDIFGQRYASSGAPLGSEFRVNSFTTYNQSSPSVAADASGSFVVVWNSSNQDLSGLGVFGQRYASSGTPLGPEFRVNTSTQNSQLEAHVALDSSGNFVVAWSGGTPYPSSIESFGQRYGSSGVPVGPEFRVNTVTTGNQRAGSVAADSSGNFVVVWGSSGQDGSGYGVFGQRYGQIVPVELMRFGVE